jgi:hypothetical protein
MIKWLFTPFNELDDRPIDVIIFFTLLPISYIVIYVLLSVFAQ